MKKSVKMLTALCLSVAVLSGFSGVASAAGSNCYAVYKSGSHSMDAVARTYTVAHQRCSQKAGYWLFDYCEHGDRMCSSCRMEDGTVRERFLYSKYIKNPAAR